MKIFRLLILTACLFAQSAFAIVNINTADAETIASELKGIGASKATAIIEYRDQNGAFKTVEELANVKGIGLKTVEKNRAEIVLK
ncbi:MAG: ComEA family DNA-binding protein [Proteobacteria bacterium]|nr:ComEA family DNA-binding protein [Pseudomonadota bacterium]